MSKAKIKLVTIGHMPLEFQSQKISKWKSSIFEIVEGFDKYALRCDSDGDEWEFSDQLVKQQLPQQFNADFMIAIVNVPIEENWYSRPLGNNQAVITFHEIKDILKLYNIPLENLIFRLLYAYALMYRRSGNKIPDFSIESGVTHDETRGCLFDKNGIKTDLIASCHKPKICEDCQERLRREKVSQSDIENTQKEIKKIQKDLYFRILDQIKRYPIWSLILSSLFALALGILSSVIGSYAYSYFELQSSQNKVITNNSGKLITNPE
jgi:hypothetical protein